MGFGNGRLFILEMPSWKMAHDDGCPTLTSHRALDCTCNPDMKLTDITDEVEPELLNDNDS